MGASSSRGRCTPGPGSTAPAPVSGSPAGRSGPGRAPRPSSRGRPGRSRRRRRSAGRSRGRAAPRSAWSRPRSARAGPGSPSSPPPRPSAVAGADPPAAAARRQTSTSASARRWSLVRRSEPCSVEGCGAASGPRIASSTADPSGSSRSRYSAIPSSSNGWDRAVPCLSRSSRRWNSPSRPYLAINARAQRPDLPRPLPLRQRHEPAQHRPLRTPGSAGAAACPSRPSRPPRCGPAPAPQHRLAQHPVARLGDPLGHPHQRGRTAGAVGRPQCRTHPADDAASEARTSPRDSP